MARFGGIPVEETAVAPTGGRFGGVLVEQPEAVAPVETQTFTDVPPAVGDEQAIDQPQSPSLYDDFKRQIGRTARIGAEAIGALPLMAMDAGVASRNLLTGHQYELPSAMYQRGLDQLGLPRPEGAIEKGVDIAGQIIAGSKTMPQIGIAKQAPAGFTPKAETAKNIMQQDIIKQGEKFNVPVYYDDIGGAASKKLGLATEEIPIVGTSAGRAKQAVAATEAMSKKAVQLDVGDEIPELLQKGLQGKLKSFRTTSGKLYDKASGLLNPRGAVDTNKFDAAIDAQILAQEKLGTAANKNAVELLKKYKDAPRGDFALMREIRSQLGSDVSDFYTGGSPIGEKGVGAIQNIKNALEVDMSKFADDAGGQAKQMWRKADAFYRKGVIPFKQAGLKQIVKSDEPEKAWKYLVAQGGVRSRAVRMYTALTPEGRSTVRYGLVKEAIDKATTKQGISPAKFAGYLEKHSDAVKTFFKGKELDEIEGIQRLMRQVERAGQFAEAPPTGKRVIPFILGGQAVASFFSPAAATATAGIAAATKTISLLFQTKAGRNALIAASKYKTGTPQMEKLTKYIASTIATQRD